MAFAIMRMAKIKETRGVVMTLDHNNRERMPKNADPEKSAKNQTYGGSTLESMNRYHQLLPGKVRKNAVLAVELVFTASKDFKGKWTDYVNDCMGWAGELFGKKNLLHWAYHKDEETPHLHIMFVPVHDGKLNSKHFIGGHRDRMAELQTDFWEKVGRPHGLERGKPAEETRAKHEKNTLDKKAEALDAQEKNLVEKLQKIEDYHKGQKELADKRIKELEAREKKLDVAKKAFNYNWLGDTFHDLSQNEVGIVVETAQNKADELRASHQITPNAPTQSTGRKR